VHYTTTAAALIPDPIPDGYLVEDTKVRTHPEHAGRITYLDGLRGVAIAMVLVFHAWYHYMRIPDALAYRPRTFMEAIVRQGYQGVSLFLVLSGFCLAYPLLRRREDGRANWFAPPVFYARRALRILPPYYAAVALFVGLSVLIAHNRWPLLSIVGQPPGRLDVLSHLALVHNVTGFNNSINGSFWSLGLEWQWYWAFPLVLALCVWRPRVALGVCFGIAIAWHVWTHDLWSLGALPARLFEFCCGIAAASLVVLRAKLRRRVLVAGIVLPLLLMQARSVTLAGHETHAWLINHSLHAVDSLGLTQPLWGVVFASLLLLGYHCRWTNAVLSWRPLAALGIASYSIYLIHEPVIQAVETWVPPGLARSPVIMPIALACGIVCGVLFHVCIERPCMRRATWQAVSPALLRLFARTDVMKILVLAKKAAWRMASDAHPDCI